MSADTARLSVEHHKLGKPGGPGLFHDKSMQLPAYIQNIAHALMRKRGMPESKAIQVAIGVVKNWASGRGDVKPEVRAAAAKAVAEWEAAKAKARATPNKSDLSNPMELLRGVLAGSSQPVDLASHALTEGTREKAAKEHLAMPDGSFPIRDRVELRKAILAHGRAKDPQAVRRWIVKRARELKAADLLPEGWESGPDSDGDTDDVRLSHRKPSGALAWLRSILPGSGTPVELATPQKGPQGRQKAKDDSGQHPTKHQLPPGAVGWKHGWVPVDSSGRPVGPSQMNKSAQEIKDMVGHDKATQDAIHQAYANKAKADAGKAARKAAAKAKSAAHKAAAAKKAAARKAAADKARAERQKAAQARRDAATKAREQRQKDAAHKRLIADAIRQALADQKAGRKLTDTQEALLYRAEQEQKKREEELRNVQLSQPVDLAVSASYGSPTVDSSDGPRATVNTLMTTYPKKKLAAAVRARRTRRKKGVK